MKTKIVGKGTISSICVLPIYQASGHAQSISRYCYNMNQQKNTQPQDLKQSVNALKTKENIRILEIHELNDTNEKISVRNVSR